MSLNTGQWIIIRGDIGRKWWNKVRKIIRKYREKSGDFRMVTEYDIPYTGKALKICIREAGYTKVSFAKKADISRPTLDRILNGELDNKSTFDKHVQKIFGVLKVSVDDVMYHAEPLSSVQVVYSANEPDDYVMSDREKLQHELL